MNSYFSSHHHHRSLPLGQSEASGSQSIEDLFEEKEELNASASEHHLLSQYHCVKAGGSGGGSGRGIGGGMMLEGGSCR
jgi:hypothetical protein